MRQFAAVLILIALFVVLVGSRFHASDGDRLAAIARLTGIKIGNAMPGSVTLATPIDLLRKEFPLRPEEAVKTRIGTDKRLAGLNVKIFGEGTTVKLRGVVPDANTRKVLLGLAESAVGVEQVIDELAIPE